MDTGSSYFLLDASWKLFNAKWIQNDPVQNGYTSKVSRFFVGNGSTNGSGCLRGLLRLIKTHFENIFGRPF